MRSVKDAGLDEVRRLKNRIGRALGKGDIAREDHDFIRDHLDQVEDRIVEMEEKEEDGSP